MAKALRPRTGRLRDAQAAPPARPRRSKHVAIPAEVSPMLAVLVKTPPKGEWQYELKFDGYRALALIGHREARLVSRTGNDLGRWFPEIVEAVKSLRLRDAILDGELVALDAEGRPSFQDLQARTSRGERLPVFYYLFDLLRRNGKDLRDQPLAVRRAALETALARAPASLRYSATLGTDAARILPEIETRGLEGLVGKRTGSTYRSGLRSGQWIKLKVFQQNAFLIGGFTLPERGPRPFAGLIVGQPELDGLRFVGKVGTGFSERTMRQLHDQLVPLATAKCPFVDLPTPTKSRWGQGLSAAEMRQCRWVNPVLACRIKFTERTREGKLRHPVFAGLQGANR